jgi:hypothetical protein
MPKAFEPKSTNPALGQLVRLHADIGGKIAENKKLAARLATDMMHVEAVIRMFDPAYDARRIAVKRRQKRNPWFRRGHMFRAAIDVLREAGGPLETRELAVRLLVGQGVAEPTLAQIRNMTGALRPTLDKHAGKTVERVGEGMPARWRVA